MKRIVLLLLISVSLTHAAEHITLKVDGKPSRFVRFPERHLTLSADCENLACEAYVAFQKSRQTRISPRDHRAGRNPGAVLCVQLNGTVRIGADEQGNQQSFCAFPDHSLVSTGSLRPKR